MVLSFIVGLIVGLVVGVLFARDDRDTTHDPAVLEEDYDIEPSAIETGEPITSADVVAMYEQLDVDGQKAVTAAIKPSRKK